jgi:hypothetical protein
MIELSGVLALSARYAAMNTQPLRVTLFTRGAQVATYDHPFLDGILAWCVVNQITKGRSVSDAPDDGYLIPLPLECLWRDERGFPLWAATQLHPEGVNEADVWYRHKRPPSGRFTHAKTGKFNISPTDGRFMERRVPVPTVAAEQWVATCVGNAIEIGRLLETLRAVGKESHRGLGAVDHWLIEPYDRFYLVDNIRLTRRIPVGGRALLGGYEPQDAPVLAGWTPPHWKRVLWGECWDVGTACELDFYDAPLSII